MKASVAVLAAALVGFLGWQSLPASGQEQELWPAHTELVVSQGAPRAGRVFIGFVFFVGEQARARYRRVLFECGAWTTTRRGTRRTLRRALTGLESSGTETTVCAWHVPRGTARRTLQAGWSYTFWRHNGSVVHADGGGPQWRIAR